MPNFSHALKGQNKAFGAFGQCRAARPSVFHGVIPFTQTRARRRNYLNIPLNPPSRGDFWELQKTMFWLAIRKKYVKLKLTWNNRPNPFPLWGGKGGCSSFLGFSLENWILETKPTQSHQFLSHPFRVVLGLGHPFSPGRCPGLVSIAPLGLGCEE